MSYKAQKLLPEHMVCIWCVGCSQVSQNLQWVLLLMNLLCCICQVRCLRQDISTPTASHKSLHDSFEIFYRQRHTNLCTRQALVSMRDMTVCWCLRACAACWGSSGPTALPSRTCSPGRRLITSALSHADRIEHDAAQQTCAINHTKNTTGPDNKYAWKGDRLELSLH